MASDNVSIGRFNLDGIASAQRGIPQVEVTFDIDADGILKVSAKDKGTGKEQHITITGRSGLDEKEIERLVDEASEFAEEDKAKKELIEAKNSAESTVYAAEKMLDEHGDKATEEQTSDIKEKLENLKSLVQNEGSTAEALTEATNTLQASMQSLGQNIYSQAQPESPTGDGTDNDNDPDTIEGDYKEV